jgi:hypothetical protein
MLAYSKFDCDLALCVTLTTVQWNDFAAIRDDGSFRIKEFNAISDSHSLIGLHSH